MSHTIAQFNAAFPNDDACLEYLFQSRFDRVAACPKCEVLSPKYYRVKNRKCYECKDCGFQLHPISGTIFLKSDTPLKSWFTAIFMLFISKNGVAAKELERTLGVTYKCAWRIANRVRKLMTKDPEDRLVGLI